MLVVYKGHEKVLMTDFNGRRYCFEKGKPVEIPQEVYDEIVLSGHVDAMALRPVELPKEEKKTEEIKPAPIKEKTKPKHKKR